MLAADSGRQQSGKEVSHIRERCERGSTSDCVILIKYDLVV